MHVRIKSYVSGHFFLQKNRQNLLQNLCNGNVAIPAKDVSDDFLMRGRKFILPVGTGKKFFFNRNLSHF